MPRAIWKGAITFGLVLVPVALYPAAEESDIDFDWLDKRSMDPVGYKRINKRTGREIAKGDIVRGIKHKNGEYVLLTDEEIKAAYPKTTQTIEIEAFVDAQEIPSVFLERPYYLAPLERGERVYALLREAMHRKNVVGVSRIVMHTKEHLAALIPDGRALTLNTLRWADEIRPASGLTIPSGKAALGFKESELKMAGRLIEQLTTPWKPERYAERFTRAVKKLVARRVKAGKTEAVEPLESAEPIVASNVFDLTQLLENSLGRRKRRSARSTPATSGRRAAKQAHRKRA